MDKKQIWWEDPIAEDYQGKQIAKLQTTVAQGSSLPLGVTMVSYSAHDEFGGVSNCIFNVTVLSQGRFLK